MSTSRKSLPTLEGEGTGPAWGPTGARTAAGPLLSAGVGRSTGGGGGAGVGPPEGAEEAEEDFDMVSFPEQKPKTYRAHQQPFCRPFHAEKKDIRYDQKRWDAAACCALSLNLAHLPTINHSHKRKRRVENTWSFVFSGLLKDMVSHWRQRYSVFWRRG